MAMGVIELGTITRAQDYSVLKQNEDNRSAINQGNSLQQVQKNESRKSKEVNKGDEAGWTNHNPDARNKGGGQYSGDGGKHRKQGSFEKVVQKNGSGFDLKI